MHRIPFLLTVLILLALPSTATSQAVPSSADDIRLLILSPFAVAPGLAMESNRMLHPGSLAANSRRSVPLAFGASAVLPGAGQLYNRQKVKAGIAIAIEAFLITTYSLTRRDGLDGEDEFRAFAHQNWSPTKYASWMNDFRDYLNEEYSTGITAPPVDIISGVDFSNPGEWSSSDQQAVQQMFNQIQAIERQAIHPETGAAFSHQVPNFAEQQYYELIGKYFQFAPGWYDYPDWKDAEGAFLAAIDPELSGPNDTKPNVSDTFYSYAKDHADAQDLLRKASRMSILFIFNHLIAGIDAAVSAKIHNDRLDTSMGMAFEPDGRAVPVLRMSLRLGSN